MGLFEPFLLEILLRTAVLILTLPVTATTATTAIIAEVASFTAL